MKTSGVELTRPRTSRVGSSAGVGAALREGLNSGKLEAKRTANTITGIVNRGQLPAWDIPGEVMAQLPGWLMDAAHKARAEGDTRTLTSLTKALTALADHNLRRAEGLDKATRLDEGGATEHHVFGVIEFSGGKRLSEVPDGSHTQMEPVSIPPTSESQIERI